VVNPGRFRGRCEGGRENRCESLGHKYQPVRDPQRFPVCPRCKELAALL
jgi:hypothetical protein